MKLNNIFDRLRKHDNIPMSLFPCSSMTRTSMQIGRATPLYCCEMIQGNTIELSASQLTRFATLKAPVMNNYEISYGFFFVPYVALDEYFTTPFIKDVGNPVASNFFNYQLKARNFFNPATPDSDRVHPIMCKLSKTGGINLIGSLWDNLGYYVGSNLYLEDYKPYFALKASPNTATAMTVDDCYSTPSIIKCASNSLASGTNYIISGSTYSASSQNFIPDIVAWYANKRHSNQFHNGNLLLWTKTEIDDYVTAVTANTSTGVLVRNELAPLYNYFYGMDSNQSPYSIEDILGNTKPAEVLDEYCSYLKAIYLNGSMGDFELSLTRWLCFWRIYADWFLNPNYTRRDEFLTMIGELYVKVANGTMSFNQASTTTASASWTTAGLHTCHSTVGFKDLQFFASYIANGQCPPVLWELSRATNLRCEADIAGFDSSRNVISSFSANDTPVGTTIREHFFNRAYQRFKDLIARVGYDYRDNTASLYGSRVDDSTLLRSQIVGIKKFAVNVGDIAQTSSNSERGNLGDFAGIGLSKDGTDKVRWKAEENGLFMVIAWVRPRNVAYANGVDRDLFKHDYFDYLLPQFGGVGYQDMYAGEIGVTDPANAKNSVGKEEIYSEYMSVPNHVHGNFRTYNKHWSSDRYVENYPTLGRRNSPKFLYITASDDCNRIFNDTLTDPILCTCYFDGTVTRQLPSTIHTDF